MRRETERAGEAVARGLRQAATRAFVFMNLSVLAVALVRSPH